MDLARSDQVQLRRPEDISIEPSRTVSFTMSELEYSKFCYSRSVGHNWCNSWMP